MTNQPEISPLVGAQALQGLRGTPGLLVIDCRHDLTNAAAGPGAYAAGHVPGAIFADMDEDLSGPHHASAGRHPLPSPAAFAATLQRWGFTASSQVVVYDQGNGALASRLWWMLRARGHWNVQLLDGGYAAWLAAGYAVDTSVPQPVATVVPVRDFAGVLSSAEVVAGLAAHSITLVDARPADRFAGRNETFDPVPGHVPGAVSMPISGNLTSAQRFLDVAQLQQRWSSLLKPDAPIVVMCGSGITACHDLVALELAGYHGARLYAGSYSEWITDPARPVVAEDVRT